MTFEEYLKQTYGLNEPIYVEEIKFEDYSRSWLFKEIKKLVDSGKLKRFDTGIYYFPENLPWGDSLVDPRKVVRKRFLTDGENTYGYIAGLSLMNSAGLSTQCPNLTELVSNNESARVRDIFVGPQRIRARKSRTNITNENANVLQFLDLMSNITPKFMDDSERFMLSEFAKLSGVTQAQVAQYSGLFPAKAMKNMLESGVVYELTP